jgi:hypothetical protein
MPLRIPFGAGKIKINHKGKWGELKRVNVRRSPYTYEMVPNGFGWRRGD